jgi:L-lactate dehydrogenase
MKVGIIGSGLVGSTAAFSIMMQNAANEIILIDKNHQRAKAEADDILHASPFAHPVNIYAGDYADLSNSDLVVITAGASQKPGQTRLDLLNKNAAIIKDIVGKILEQAPGAILLIATNPVDAMTHLAARYAKAFGLPASKVIGTGTTLDTARFKSLLGIQMGVDPKNVHAYVIGEHGDSEVLTWSIIDIGGLPLEEYTKIRKIQFGKDEKEAIDKKIRYAAYDIIRGKGSTYYGIGGAIAKIINIIKNNQRSFITICTPVREVAGVQNVTISMPHLLGSQGVISTLPFNLNKPETEALIRSAEIIKSEIDKITYE